MRECREKGLDVVEGDLVDFLRAQAGGLPRRASSRPRSPSTCRRRSSSPLLAEAHRALRPGGLLLLETVNPRSVTGLLEVFNRDLTHERPLHPDTLRFLAAAAGFTDVRVEMRTPVPAGASCSRCPPRACPSRPPPCLNENVARLNALLYGPLEYALVARR